jgi:hypothetical protein
MFTRFFAELYQFVELSQTRPKIGGCLQPWWDDEVRQRSYFSAKSTKRSLMSQYRLPMRYESPCFSRITKIA